MFGYITLGSNDVAAAGKFYDALFADMDISRCYSYPSFIGWSKGESEPFLAVTQPYDGNEATVGNGVMVALRLASATDVDQCYAKAIELGAVDEGQPGERAGGFYAAYFRDLDGNKINCHCLG